MLQGGGNARGNIVFLKPLAMTIGQLICTRSSVLAAGGPSPLLGRSRCAPSRDFSKHAADARALLHRLDARPAILVGWSAGGTVALQIALSDPEAVVGLVHHSALPQASTSGRVALRPSGARSASWSASAAIRG